jgi:hypothetical protein
MYSIIKNLKELLSGIIPNILFILLMIVFKLIIQV